MASSKPLPLIPWSKTDILSESNSFEVTQLALNTALDIIILGFPIHANRLISTLYNSIPILQFDEAKNLYPLHLAWKATNTTPSFIQNLDPGRVFNGFDDSEEGKQRWNRFKDGLKAGWPDQLWEKKIKKEEEGSGKMFGEDDVEFAMQHLNEEPGNTFSKTNTAFAAAIEVAILAGSQEKVRELVETMLVDLYRHFQESWSDRDVTHDESRKWMADRMCIEGSEYIWDNLKDGIIGKVLKVDEDALIAFVDEGCRLVEERFTKGPARPYADKSIPELLQIMDESYIAARKADPEAGEHMSILNMEDWVENPTSFLKPAATDDEIKKLRTKLIHLDDDGVPIELPADYAEFLKFSNGFYPGDDKGDATGIFSGIQEIDRENSAADFLADMEFTLFPYSYTTLDEDFNNIQLPEDIKAFSVGPGGDEGYIWLVEPPSVKKILEDFEEVYERASERDKRMYERAAMDLYGGIEKLRGLEWLAVVTYHWDPDERIFG